MFIGGLSWETTVDEMKEYFAKYGDVKDAGMLIGTDMLLDGAAKTILYYFNINFTSIILFDPDYD